nr:hypothetical protein [Cytophagales bacterium]
MKEKKAELASNGVLALGKYAAQGIIFLAEQETFFRRCNWPRVPKSTPLPGAEVFIQFSKSLAGKYQSSVLTYIINMVAKSYFKVFSIS